MEKRVENPEIMLELLRAQDQADETPPEIELHRRNLAGSPNFLENERTQHFDKQMWDNQEGHGLATFYYPQGEGPFPAFIYHPGTGFVAEHPQIIDSIASRIVKISNCVVIVVHVRLAPEYHYPCATRDISFAIDDIFKNAERYKIDRNRVTIGGYSAGGNLAFLSAKYCLQKGYPVYQQALISPALDLTRPRHRTPYSAYEELEYKKLEKFVVLTTESYLGSRVSAADPNVSPLFQDHTKANTPPTILFVGENDMIRGDTEQYALILEALNTHYYKHVIPGYGHNAWWKLQLVVDMFASFLNNSMIGEDVPKPLTLPISPAYRRGLYLLYCRDNAQTAAKEEPEKISTSKSKHSQ